MTLVDTHVHLNNANMLTALEGILDRAIASEVHHFVNVGWDKESSALAVRQAEADSRIGAAVGIHPHSAETFDPAVESVLRDLLAHPRTVALGEIGLDYYRNLSPVETQKQAFIAQMHLSAEFGKPILIHCRDAYPDTLALLQDHAKGLSVLLHCFAGSADDAKVAVDNGWYLGVGGSVTFAANHNLRAILATVPRTALVLETDAPYLSPVPLRGKYPNEPARLTHILETVARVRGESIADVAEFTTANAFRLFTHLAPPSD